jgi:predicted NBD/HSP70 family sugar kinase
MLDAVAIGVPGPVAGNTMGHSAPLGLAGSFSFSDCFPDAQHLIVRNDVYIALIAEIRAGAGRRFQNFVLVSISTGTGAGVAISGQPLDIRTEMGHQKFWMDTVSERPCISHSGCWESICSGAALADADRARSAQEVRKANIYAFANLALAYDPSAIAVMGGVALNRYDELIPDQTDLAHHVISKPTPQILKSELGPQIGVYGAMKLAEEHIKLTLRHKS